MTDDATPDPGAQPTPPYDPQPWWSRPPEPSPDDVSDTTRVLPPYPPPAERSGSGHGLGRIAGVGALVLVVALGSGLAGAEIALHRDGGSTTPIASGTVVKGGTSPTETLAKVAAAVMPSVVSIQVAASGGSDEGSGVIMTSNGSILTNNHVISAAADGGTITVTFSNGDTAKATIVGRDASTDLAVIKASGVSNLKPATFGDSNSVHVGDTVLAIGSPLGLEGSVSAGIISALHRPVDVGSDEPQQKPVRRPVRPTAAEPGQWYVDRAGRRDPDRRADQPGQLGRPARRRAGQGHRHQLGHRLPVGRRHRPVRQHRCRLRDPGR